MPKYMYNPRTATLHIVGYCHISRVRHPFADYKYFDTEKKAHEYAGEHIKPCKLCESEKEKRLNERK